MFEHKSRLDRLLDRLSPFLEFMELLTEFSLELRELMPFFVESLLFKVHFFLKFSSFVAFLGLVYRVALPWPLGSLNLLLSSFGLNRMKDPFAWIEETLFMPLYSFSVRVIWREDTLDPIADFFIGSPGRPDSRCLILVRLLGGFSGLHSKSR